MIKEIPSEAPTPMTWGYGIHNPDEQHIISFKHNIQLDC